MSKQNNDTPKPSVKGHISAAVREDSKKLAPESRRKLLAAADRGPVEPRPDNHPRFVS